MFVVKSHIAHFNSEKTTQILFCYQIFNRKIGSGCPIYSRYLVFMISDKLNEFSNFIIISEQYFYKCTGKLSDLSTQAEPLEGKNVMRIKKGEYAYVVHRIQLII